MKKTRIYIARHGETEYNRLDIIQGSKDIDLNEAGQAQAQALAERFTDISLDAVFSSTMKRARQTAEAVATLKNMEVTTYPELREMNFGDYEGLNYFDVEDDFLAIKSEWEKGYFDKACQNGESPNDVWNRANPRCLNIFEKNEGKNILMVLHGRLIRILFTQWFGWDLKQMNKFRTPNVSFNLLEWENQTIKPIELNITDHLVASGIAD